MTTSANDLINGALRLIGQLAEGETPSAATSTDALTAMQQMIDSWNTERLSVYNTQDQIFTWPASTATRTLGPSGDFVGNRPVAIDDATYFRDPGTNVSFNVRFINQLQYDSIAVKTVTSTYPQVCWVNMEFPNVRLTVYPVPIRSLEWHIVSVQELAQPVTLASNIYLPPGYLRAFRYNLATEIAAEFGVEPAPQVTRIAVVSKRNLKRINQPDDVMSIPSTLTSTRSRYNVFAGNF